jgi:hypothetical protein
LRRSGLRVVAKGQRLLIGDTRTGVTRRGSTGSGEDGRAARAGARTYGRRAFRDGGRRAARIPRLLGVRAASGGYT